jgi:hypothetical protein
VHLSFAASPLLFTLATAAMVTAMVAMVLATAPAMAVATVLAMAPATAVAMVLATAHATVATDLSLFLPPRSTRVRHKALLRLLPRLQQHLKMQTT